MITLGLTHKVVLFHMSQAFLFIYPTLVRKPLAIFDCFPSPRGRVLRDDPFEACDEGKWTGWAVAAAVGVVIYGFGMPFAALTLCRLFRNGSADSRERVALLVDSYKSHFWATEVYILAYKFVLTGFIPSASWSEPRIQIWLGVIGNLIASLWVLQSKPFRSKLCNAAALTALLQLLVTYVSAFLFLRNPAAAGPRIDLNSWAGSSSWPSTAPALLSWPEAVRATYGGRGSSPRLAGFATVRMVRRWIRRPLAPMSSISFFLTLGHKERRPCEQSNCG